MTHDVQAQRVVERALSALIPGPDDTVSLSQDDAINLVGMLKEIDCDQTLRDAVEALVGFAAFVEDSMSSPGAAYILIVIAETALERLESFAVDRNRAQADAHRHNASNCARLLGNAEPNMLSAAPAPTGSMKLSQMLGSIPRQIGFVPRKR